jgi:hypothetical protein
MRLRAWHENLRRLLLPVSHGGERGEGGPSLGDPVAALTACALCAPLHAEVVRTVPTPRRTRTRRTDDGHVWPLEEE